MYCFKYNYHQTKPIRNSVYYKRNNNSEFIFMGRDILSEIFNNFIDKLHCVHIY